MQRMLGFVESLYNYSVIDIIPHCAELAWPTCCKQNIQIVPPIYKGELFSNCKLLIYGNITVTPVTPT